MIAMCYLTVGIVPVQVKMSCIPGTKKTRRQRRPPSRFGQEEFVALPSKIKLYPSQGQPKKYGLRIIRLPELGVRQSRIHKAGFGLFLRERVRKGQVIARYRRRIISEATAKKLKAKVVPCFYFPYVFAADFKLCKGNRHIRANHAKCCCLDSQPTATEGHEFFAKIHEVAGCANSSSNPNADFVDVGFDSILEARFDMEQDTEILINYSF